MGNNNSRKDTGSAVSIDAITRTAPPIRREYIFPRPKFNLAKPKNFTGVTNIIPNDINHRLPPIESAPISLPGSYRLWEENYYPNRVRQDVLETFRSRITERTNEFQIQKEIEDIQQRRLKETAKFYSNHRAAPTPTPSLNSLFPIKPVLKTYQANDQKYFTPKPRIPPLPIDSALIIKDASVGSPPDQVLVKIEDVEVMRKDIQTLLRLNWLNDEIVNAYMSLLVCRGRIPGYKKVYATNTYFYPKLRDSGYSSVRRWTRKVDIFSYDFVLVPVHLGNHWCLAFIDFTKREISYYDSLGGSTNNCCDILLDYLREESRDKKKQDFDDENWQLFNKYQLGIPQQENGSDCGVFACIYAEYLTREAELEFSQEDMQYFRRKMIYEIIKRQIVE